jgi:uncharacterized protein (DUF362 family)
MFSFGGVLVLTTNVVSLDVVAADYLNITKNLEVEKRKSGIRLQLVN